jgi:two-component system sensor histidine kinase YesM
MQKKHRLRKVLSFKLLRNQLILWFIIVIVLLLSIIAGFIVLTLRPNLYDTNISHLQKIVDLLSWELANQREKLQSYSINILSDVTVQAFLMDYLNDLSGIANQLRLLMMSYTEYNRAIKGVYLADLSGKLYGNFVTPTVQAYADSTLKDLLLSDGSAIWSANGPDDAIVMCRAIHDTTHDLTHTIGALYLMIDRRSFTDVCERFLDHGLRYRLENSSLLLGTEPLEQNEVMSCFVCTATHADWRLSVWLDRDAVYAPVNAILNLIIYCVLGAFLIGACLTIFVSGRLTRPLRELRHAMERAGSGDLNANVDVHREDEVAHLARAYNRMLDDTKEHIRQSKEHQKRQKALELKTLQYQVNPHFLYNTLDSIYMIARQCGNSDIAKMVVLLSTLFRLSLAQGQEFVTLEHEINYISCYLQIQLIRFPSSFIWKTEIPEELLHCRVLKFILQPLVENSLNHGLRNNPDGGEIVVSALREADDLVLCVADNGTGMTEQQLEQLRAHIDRTDIKENQNPFESGVGLHNVHQRLLLTYGRGLHIQSDWEEGTTVFIYIPYEKMQETKEAIQ